MAMQIGHIFPADLINPKEKNKSWLLKIGRAINNYSLTGATSYGAFSKATIVQLKNYANGRQDPTQYMPTRPDREKKGTPVPEQNPQLSVDTRAADWKRKAMDNINWSIWSPMPKIIESISTFVGQSDYRIQCEHVSLQGKKKKEQKKISLWFQSRPEFQEVSAKLAISGGVPNPALEFIPDSIEELEVWEKLGGTKLMEEIAVEDLTEHNFEISNWENLKDKIIYELCATNSACTRDYNDPVTGAAKAMVIPLENLIYPYFNEATIHNPPFVGHYDIMTIQDLMPYMIKDGWSDEQILKLAEQAMSYQPDFLTSLGWQWYKEKDPETNGWRFLDFQLQVIYFEYISVDREYYEGEKKIEYNEGIGRHKVSSENLEMNNITYNIDTHTVYEGCYVVQGDFLAYGNKQVNQKRKDGQTPMLSYHLWRIGANSSIAERTIPALDQLQRLMLKIESFISAAVPPGLAVDIQFITGIGKMTEWEIIARYKETGNLIYRIKPEMRKLLPSGQPFQEMKGGLGAAYMEVINAVNDTLRWVYELSGVTEIFAGSPSNDQEGLGLNRMAVQGSANAVSKLSRGLMKIKEETAKGLALRAITNIKYDKATKEYYEAILGENKVAALIESDATLEQMGMYMVAMPQIEMKDKVMQAAQQALSVGRDGQHLITYAQYFRIANMLENGDVKEAQAYLSIEEAKTLKRIEKIKMDAIAAQGEQLQGVEQVKAQMMMQQEQQKHVNKIEQIRMEKIGEMGVELVKMQQDLQNNQNMLILQSILTPPNAKQSAI